MAYFAAGQSLEKESARGHIANILSQNAVVTEKEHSKKYMVEGKVKKKGGRIKVPSPPQSDKQFQIHDDPTKKHIPLDRGGRHLPRYMQETGSSRRMLSLRRADRRVVDPSELNIIERFHHLQSNVIDLQTEVSKLKKMDGAYDIEIKKSLLELSKLKVYEKEDGPIESETAQTEYKYNEMRQKLGKEIQNVQNEADTAEKELQSGALEYSKFMDNLTISHQEYVRSRYEILAGLEKNWSMCTARNAKFMETNSDIIKQSEYSCNTLRQEVNELEQRTKELRQCLAEEGGLELHRAKLLNAKQYNIDLNKYQQIISHLKKKNCELSMQLNSAASERDALVEESRLFA